MALSNELGLCGFHPLRIETTATATLEDLAAGWTVTGTNYHTKWRPVCGATQTGKKK